MTTTQTLWTTTGNPFVDTGQEMMAAMARLDRPEDLTLSDVKPLVPRLTELYLQEGWRKNLQSIFPNSKLVNPAVKKRREAYEELLGEWLYGLQTGRHLDTACAISGRPADVYVGKVYLPMSDFGGGNFQSANQEGVPLSAPVALALQFFPLALVRVGKWMALPHFSAREVQQSWADERIKNVQASEALGKGAVQESGTSRPENAFFRLVENLLRHHQDVPDSSVTLYLFNNFNQVDYKSATEIHHMPLRVFRFIRAAMGGSAEQLWRTVVWRGYVNRKEGEGEQEALRRYNGVYRRLLNGESISGYFVDIRRRAPVVRGEMGWRLFSGYQREVNGMDRRRIDSLRDLGDRIAPIVRERRKRLLALERADSRGRLTDSLYRLAKDSMVRGAKEPLITFDQLVSDVFPHDTAYSDWREVKYLLLFRIYEQLFDELKEDLTYADTEEDSEEQEEVVGEQR